MEDRAATLRQMRICRFCLTEKDPLSNIYERECKNAIPLPLQIMACVAIEVFSSDGMPQLICDDCRIQTKKSYTFKTMCKQSEDALKLYLATGILQKKEKGDILEETKHAQKRSLEVDTLPSSQEKETKKIKKELDQQQQEETSVVAAIAKIETQVETVIEQPTLEQVEQTIETEEQIEEIETVFLKSDDIYVDNTPKSSTKQVITHCFPCIHCERSFPLQQLLDIHMRQHTRERKFSCLDCKKKFFTKHDLIKHSQTHTGDKPFVCVVCKKSFSRATLLHRHEKVHVTVPKYLCTYCDKTYLTSEDLDTHMQTHKKRRPFKCDKCEKSFAFKQGLERHEIVHSSENPHKCNYCEESFTTPGKLARHVTSHAGARPYPCKLCSRTFLLSHHLTRHLRNHYNRKAAHTEIGIHKCDVCSMSFRRKDSLVNHTAIHSMVNLKCVICNKEFSDAKTVKQHVTTHLSGLPFPCDKCDYSFETQEELEDHEVKHVDIDDNDDNDENYDDDEYVLSVPTVQQMQQIQQIEEPEPTLPTRRSKREPKLKNYADFLTDEQFSDSEECVDEPEEDVKPVKVPVGTILPVVRSETMKVYKGKEKSEKTPEKAKPLAASTPKPVEIVKPQAKFTTLESLGIPKSTLDAMTEKSGFVEMKMGQKVIRVQKVMMTKADMQAMTEQGKIGMKGSPMMLKNVGNLPLNKLCNANLLNKSSLAQDLLNKPISQNANKVIILNQTVPQDTSNVNLVVKTVIQESTTEEKVDNQPNVDIPLCKTPVRTYVKRLVKVKEEIQEENAIVKQENDRNTCTTEVNIDLANSSDNSTSLQESDILGTF